MRQDRLEDHRPIGVLDIRGRQVNGLDLLVEILFLVGQVFVTQSNPLDVRLVLQHRQRRFDPLRQLRDILVQAVQEEDAKVPRRGLKLTYVLHEEQRLQNANRKGVVQVAFADDDLVDLRVLEREADAVEPVIERHKRPHRRGNRIAQTLRRVLTDGQHRPFSNRGIASGERIVRRKIEHRRLKEVELVGNERIGRDECLLVRVGRIPLRSVGEVKKHLQVCGETVVKRRELGNRLRCLLQ